LVSFFDIDIFYYRFLKISYNAIDIIMFFM